MPPSRDPSPPALAALEAALGGDDPALPFARAVLVQVALQPGAARDPSAELAAARAIAGVLARRTETVGADECDPVRTLAADPVLLAAFFQNVDLLYDAASPDADRVSGWIMEAVGMVGG